MLDNVICALGLTSIDLNNHRSARFAPRAVPALGRPQPEGYGGIALEPTSSASLELHVQNHEHTRPAIIYQSTTQPTPFDLYRSLGTNNPSGAIRKGCPCHALSLAVTPEAVKGTPMWLCTPKWDANASWAEIKKEEARRLVWSTITLVSGDASARLALGFRQLNLHISRPENVSLASSQAS